MISDGNLIRIFSIYHTFSFLGMENFQAGIRLYLKRHSYGNACTSDLWAALGVEAARIMPAWTLQVSIVSWGLVFQNNLLFEVIF
jgi:hypothetical protein